MSGNIAGCQTVCAAPAKDNLRLLDCTRNPIRQEAGLLTYNAGDINDAATFNANKMVVPGHAHLIKSRAGTRIREHDNASFDQRIDDIVDGSARQWSSLCLEFFK